MAREYNSHRGRKIPPPLIRIGLRLRGDLNTDALKQALDDLLCRHPALRTAFLENPGISSGERDMLLEEFARTGIVQGGLYTQMLLQHAEGEIRTIDMGRMDDAERQSAIQTVLAEEGSRPFNHRFPPLVRSVLIRTAPGEHLFVFLVDHLVCDGISASVISNDFEQLYTARAGGRHLPTKSSVPSSLDFAAWQHAACTSPYFDKAIRYWRNQWAEFAPARISFDDLPFALAPPSEPDLVFATERTEINAPDSAAIRNFARRNRMTPFVTFLAAFALVLGRYTGKPRVAIWGHLSNRQNPYGSAVGWFANTHILGIDLSQRSDGLELLRHVRSVVSEALAFQGMPLPHLWRTLQCGPRFPDIVPLLDYRSNVNADCRAVGSSDRIEIRRVDLPDSRAPRLSALGVYVHDAGSMLVSSKFSSKRFSREAIRRLLQEVTDTACDLVDSREELLAKRSSASGQTPRTTLRRMSEFVLVDCRFLASDPLTLPSVPEVRGGVTGPALRS